jgi:hypothetical protein
VVAIIADSTGVLNESNVLCYPQEESWVVDIVSCVADVGKISEFKIGVQKLKLSVPCLQGIRT